MQQSNDNLINQKQIMVTTKTEGNTSATTHNRNTKLQQKKTQTYIKR